MESKRPEQCGKGDFLVDLEIVIERSRTNDKDMTILFWKNHKDKFGVEKYHGKDFEKRIQNFTPDEALARRKYEECCDDNPGCSPYPEAEAYYKDYCKKKGIKWIMDC